MNSLLNSFPIIDGTFYGCDQSWFQDEDKQKSGCASAAAANLALIYSGNFAPSKDEAVNLMNLLYDSYVSQTVGIKGTGVWFMGDFIRGMLRWFEDNKIAVTPHTINDILTRDPSEAVLFIKDALQKNLPVILLLWNSTQATPWHYVTITAIEENGADFDLTVSSWGEKITYKSFSSAWSESGLLSNAFLTYFELLQASDNPV